MAKQYFKLLSDVTILYPRDYELVDPTIIDPLSTSALLPGEWLKLQLVGTDDKAARGSGIETSRSIGPWFADFRGRTDVQAAKRVPLLMFYDFEALTSICDTTGLSTAGLPLMVNDVTVDGMTAKRGLVIATTGTRIIPAIYLSPGERTGEIRFKRIEPTSQAI